MKSFEKFVEDMDKVAGAGLDMDSDMDMGAGGPGDEAGMESLSADEAIQQIMDICSKVLGGGGKSPMDDMGGDDEMKQVSRPTADGPGGAGGGMGGGGFGS